MKGPENRSNGTIHVGSDVTGAEANTVLVDSYVQGTRGQREMGRLGNVPCYR
jgi:hypothetical protein